MPVTSKDVELWEKCEEVARLLAVARAAVVYLNAEMFTGELAPAEDELEAALAAVEDLL